MSAMMHLNTLVSNMFATGMLDDQFHQLEMLKDGSTQNFFSEVVTLFCEDSERIIGEITELLDKPCVDFEKTYALVHRLKGGSSCVGAKRVKNTCIQFQEFCLEKSKEGCLKTLDAVRNDFHDLYSKFQTMLELVKQVQASYPKQ